MSTDANTLLAQAKCYLCLGITTAEALQLALLAQLATTSTGGGSITAGHGAPTFTPTTDTAIYFDEDTGAQYNFYAGVWH